MSKETLTVQGIAIKCDKCGEYYETGGEGTFYPDYYDPKGDQIEKEALEEGWVKIGDKHYCPECAPKMKVIKQ